MGRGGVLLNKCRHFNIPFPSNRNLDQSCEERELHRGKMSCLDISGHKQDSILFYTAFSFLLFFFCSKGRGGVQYTAKNRSLVSFMSKLIRVATFHW